MVYKKLLFCALLVLQTSQVWALFIELAPAHTGGVSLEIDSPVVPVPPPPGTVIPEPTYTYRHDAPLSEIFGESYASAGCQCAIHYQVNGYLIYDMANLTFEATTAALELDLRISGDMDELTLFTVDDFTPEFLAGLPVGGLGGLPEPLGEAIYTDLAQGTQLASVDISGGSGLYNANLDGAGLNLVNSANGLLAFGIVHTRLNEDEFIDVSFNSAPRLLLQGPGQVPLPGTAWLLAGAMLLLPFRARCRRLQAA